ncbi:MAG: Gfo/Idh/MocA family oxidoreductase [Nitrospirae bacterium]|nr:Gfo/Idh/MocA family oxidoreductase [Nitrospirota bacterium]
MKKVRYGVIGIKGVGQVHINAAKANNHIELVALVDVDEAKVKQVAEKYGIKGFTDYRDMVKANLVDAVSIAVPHYLHYPVGMDCLRAGVHVFMEKPFANKVSEADAMLALAEKNNLTIAVCHQYRTHRSAQRMKELLDSGIIGSPLRVLWTWGEFRPEAYYRRDPWRNTFQHAGGGVLMNQTSHDLDLICWMMGQPIQVSAMVGNQMHQEEIEDIACATVLFESGAIGSLQFTINHPRGHSVRQIQGDRGVIVMPEVKSLTNDQDEEILVGTYEEPLSRLLETLPGKDDQPIITWKSCGFMRPPVVKEKPGIIKRGLRRLGLLKWPPRPSLKDQPVNGPRQLMDSFIQAICHGGSPLVTGKSARLAIELINGIYLSAILKKTVDLPLDPSEYDAMFEKLVKGEISIPRFRGNCSGS